MSARNDIRSGIKTAIEAISLPAGTVVGTFAGEARAMQEATAGAARVYVLYFGARGGKREEFGDMSYMRSFEFIVYVATADDPDGDNGDVTVMTILETIEEGLSGQTIASIGEAELCEMPELGGMFESIRGADSGKYLYGQGWHVEEMESH